MKQKLIATLSPFGFPVLLQGTLNAEDVFPNTFITFWTNYADNDTHFENDVYSVEWSFSVILYSNDPQIVNEKPEEIQRAMKAAGFIPQGRGQDVASGEPTHTGWAMDFIYNELTKEMR